MTDQTARQPLTDQLLDEIDACVNGPLGSATDFDHTTVAPLVAEVRRLRARTLTESEYNAAWHAVEGAAGEEGADPGTVLHAVLDRLGIALPGAAEQPAVEASEACGKCKQPFDPSDTRFDGRARYHLTPYCRGCVDRCHDTEIADHRCVICA
ncbi:hypothetical protein ACFXKC_28485 [Streptomyces sp. NPDC059340]|uniref:hypothetical protein n=1 Tax=Streptomyces sp. NPDC059340 TaxID=3346806 RepID=UPI00368C420E